MVNWIDVFIRNSYREIFIDSIKYCQREKGLLLGAWAMMTSHVHLIISTRDENIENIIRDLKSYTSRHIRKEMEQAGYESRKEWMLPMFYKAGKYNPNNNDYQFWIQNNHPIQLSTPQMMKQRIDYIHNNPVEAGFVDEPHHWRWSNAYDYAGGPQGLLELTILL